MIEYLNWIVTHWTDIVQVILQVIGVASIIVKMTPTKVDDKYLNKVIEIIKMFSLHKGNDKVVISTKKK